MMLVETIKEAESPESDDQFITVKMWLITYLAYLQLKISALILRVLVRLVEGTFTSNPDAVHNLPSRDPRRKIKVHIYKPSLSKTDILEPRPVLINFHGSGFVIPAHGSDDAFCREITQRTNYTVLDVQYRLSPENPFPAAVHDVEDVVKWVLQQPAHYDLTRVAVSGFSAGGNLALVAASTLFPKDTFRSVITFYPSTEGHNDPATLVAPEAGGRTIPVSTMRLFARCYVQAEVDRQDPRILPVFADPARFPKNVLVITAGYDILADEGERLAVQLKKDPKRNVVYQRMPKCNHGWDKKALPGTREWEQKNLAYDLAVEMLRS
ncbi:alpha/beta-hydrolase [Penicillium longicatenatum]|uniref:alpha/beta-hydrolase n=1 Tax=Penicillium longicatenatum TaxID=1561947 RepID=UPI002547C9E6|nr:alpha/beta-hydrolase [Penicillium longicatenatum]KAJ5658616.1 alpha/beta-hydrolase [Penicillium longicatenatum]